MLYLLNYNMSVAVWVGLIALAGLDAETGVVMLLYLDQAWEKFRREGRMNSFQDLSAAVREGAVQRIRPKMMTVSAIIFGLLPILWSPPYQAGADVMKRIATPMIGGVITSAILELLIYPAIFVIWKKRALPKGTSPSEAAVQLPANQGFQIPHFGSGSRARCCQPNHCDHLFRLVIDRWKQKHSDCQSGRPRGQANSG